MAAAASSDPSSSSSQGQESSYTSSPPPQQHHQYQQPAMNGCSRTAGTAAGSGNDDGICANGDGPNVIVAAAMSSGRGGPAPPQPQARMNEDSPLVQEGQIQVQPQQQGRKEVQGMGMGNEDSNNVEVNNANVDADAAATMALDLGDALARMSSQHVMSEYNTLKRTAAAARGQPIPLTADIQQLSLPQIPPVVPLQPQQPLQSQQQQQQNHTATSQSQAQAPDQTQVRGAQYQSQQQQQSQTQGQAQLSQSQSIYLPHPFGQGPTAQSQQPQRPQLQLQTQIQPQVQQQPLLPSPSSQSQPRNQSQNHALPPTSLSHSLSSPAVPTVRGANGNGGYSSRSSAPGLGSLRVMTGGSGGGHQVNEGDMNMNGVENLPNGNGYSNSDNKSSSTDNNKRNSPHMRGFSLSSVLSRSSSLRSSSSRSASPTVRRRIVSGSVSSPVSASASGSSTPIRSKSQPSTSSSTSFPNNGDGESSSRSKSLGSVKPALLTRSASARSNPRQAISRAFASVGVGGGSNNINGGVKGEINGFEGNNGDSGSSGSGDRSPSFLGRSLSLRSSFMKSSNNNGNASPPGRKSPSSMSVTTSTPKRVSPVSTTKPTIAVPMVLDSPAPSRSSSRPGTGTGMVTDLVGIETAGIPPPDRDVEAEEMIPTTTSSTSASRPPFPTRQTNEGISTPPTKDTAERLKEAMEETIWAPSSRALPPPPLEGVNALGFLNSGGRMGIVPVNNLNGGVAPPVADGATASSMDGIIVTNGAVPTSSSPSPRTQQSATSSIVGAPPSLAAAPPLPPMPPTIVNGQVVKTSHSHPMNISHVIPPELMGWLSALYLGQPPNSSTFTTRAMTPSQVPPPELIAITQPQPFNISASMLYHSNGGQTAHPKPSVRPHFWLAANYPDNNNESSQPTTNGSSSPSATNDSKSSPSLSFIVTPLSSQPLREDLNDLTGPVAQAMFQAISSVRREEGGGKRSLGNFLLSSAPGKKVRLTAGPVKGGRSAICRDLATDLQRARDSGCRAVVCCLDDTELEFLGAPWKEYQEAAAKVGMDIIRIPMAEGFAPPSPAYLDANLTHIISLYTLRGESVLCHCRGGVGRAGLVACCWLLKMGLINASGEPKPTNDLELCMRNVQRVIEVIRRRRSAKAIETPQQVYFILAYADYLHRMAIPASVPEISDLSSDSSTVPDSSHH